MKSPKSCLYLQGLVLILSLTKVIHATQSKDIDGIYRGTSGNEQIVLEMGVDPVEAVGDGDRGTAVTGRYFYHRYGGCTRLKGILLPDGTINLTENEPYIFDTNEFRLTLNGDQATGTFVETHESPDRRSVKQSSVSLTRISKGFDPDLPRLPVTNSPVDQAYYDLVLKFPLRRGREIRVDKQIAYVMRGDARFPGRLPMLTRFPDRRVMAKVNTALTQELNERRLLDSGCAMGHRFDDHWEEKSSVTFLSRDILSVVRETRRYCGSYDSELEVVNYDLQTGKSLDLNDLFRMQRKGAPLVRDEYLPVETAFLPFVDLYVKYSFELQDECKKLVSREGYMHGPLGLSVYFAKEGLVLSPLLYGDNRRCADDEIIPYYELRGLIRSDTPFKSLLKLTHAKTRTLPLIYSARSLQLVHEGEFSGQDVIPPRVRVLQRRFKHQLQRFIGDVINQNAENATLQEIRLAILKKLRAMGIFEGLKEEGPNYTYGHLLDIRLDQVPQHPDLLAIRLTVDVNWDEDESLYIFQHRASGWVNVLAAEVNGYPEVWDAQSSRFNYAVSPPASAGTWFVVTSSVNPHMASAWQHVTYTAWAPGIDANHPKILVRRTHTIYLAGADDEGLACQINAKAEGFRVRFNIGSDNPPYKEYYTDEYRVVNGSAKRTALSCRTRDFRGRPVSCDPETEE